jgi:hypothetical protein
MRPYPADHFDAVTVSSRWVLCPPKPSVRKPLYEALIVPELHVKTASRCACLPDRIVIVGGRDDYCWRDDVAFIIQVISAVLWHDAQSVRGSCSRHNTAETKLIQMSESDQWLREGSARPGASPVLRTHTGSRAEAAFVCTSIHRVKGCFVPRRPIGTTAHRRCRGLLSTSQAQE